MTSRKVLIWRHIYILNDGDKNLRNTHCDIIVNIDKNAHFVDVIGGNVYQSVSLKRLWLNENNLLSPSIYDNTQTDAAAKANYAAKIIATLMQNHGLYYCKRANKF